VATERNALLVKAIEKWSTALLDMTGKAAEVAAKKVTSDERADPYWRGAFSMLFLIAIAVIVVVVWWNSSG
jgi:hypothetical protein|tara:strand:+ start:195 stop:407 length:213 start_codon:yes stop_codon:yes gene_type:complete